MSSGGDTEKQPQQPKTDSPVRRRRKSEKPKAQNHGSATPELSSNADEDVVTVQSTIY